MLNISNRKVGGIRFIRVGNLTMSFCVSDKRALHRNAEVRTMERGAATMLTTGAAFCGLFHVIAILAAI